MTSMNPDPLFAVPGELRDRRAAVLVRQSSRTQQENNVGSGLVQIQQVTFLEALGWPADRIDVIDARGESGSAGAKRPRFERLLADVAAGRYGIVTVGRSDRLGRNDVDSSRFLEAAAHTHTLVAVSGRIYNPAADADSMLLGMLSKYSEYENRARIRWMMAARWALAKILSFRIRLPTGLVWADPLDPAYRERLEEAGLLHWVEDMDRHHEVSRLEGRSLHILPFPDADVVRATQLALRWVLETGDLMAVLDRITATGEEAKRWGWPRPGCVPVLRSSRFDPSQKPVWSNLHRREQYVRLKQWLLNPALFGAYRYKAPALAKLTLGAEAASFAIRVEGAFPSYADPEDERRIRRIVSEVKRGWKRGAYNGPRRHALDVLRCAERVEDGSRCGRKMTAMYNSETEYGYYGQPCVARGHGVPHVQGSIDQSVLTIVQEVFDRESIGRAIRALEADAGANLARSRQVQKEIAQLEQKIEDASSLEMQALRDKNLRNQRHWERKREEFVDRKEELEAQFETLRAAEERLRRLGSDDIERVRDLAGALPELLERARRSNPDALREVVRELVEAVHFRRISSFAYEIDVEFPAGERVRRTVWTRNFVCTQPARIWAYGRLVDGADAAVIANELNLAPPLNHRVPWDADRVRVAADVHVHCEPEPLRAGEGVTAAELAKAYGMAHNDFLAAAFQGYLGPAAYRDGDLLLWPTEPEMHFGLPETARRDVARKTGWPLDDTALLVELSREAGVSRETAKRRAEGESGVVRDANGIRFARRSEVVFDLAAAIRRAARISAPRYADRDPASWVPLPEVKARYPHMHHRQLLETFPHVRPGIGYLASRSIYLWVDDG